MELQHPVSLKRVRAYEASSSRRSIFLALAVAVYAYVLPQCYMTAGDPRRTAIAQLEAIDAAKPPEAKVEGVWVGGRLVDQDAREFDDENINADKEGSGVTGDYFGTTTTSAEKLVEKLEVKEDWRKAFDGASIESDEIKGEDGRSLPSEWLPSAFACAALFLSMTCTALFYFLCHWMVSFKAWALYSPITNLDSIKPNKTTFFIEPVKHRGKPALVKVISDSRGGMGVLFQRQKYDVVLSHSAAFKDCKDKVVGEGEKNGAIVLVSCPVDRPVGAYVNAKGLTPSQVTSKLEQYGRNEIRIPTPKMMDLLKQQLMSPLAIFQVFCAILWMLDEYWQYTIFTLFSIVALECTTCFQRMKTFSTLGGMANKATPLMVYRSGVWSKLTTEDLLPGDLISLSTRQPGAVEPTPTTAVAVPTTGGGEKRDKRSKGDDTSSPPTEVTNKAPSRTNDVIPCDLLILGGSAVVNEASLTGESVPQMKDACTYSDVTEEMRSLDIEGRDKVHTLFSGTNIVAVSPQTKSDENKDKIITPDGGCLCYVLRTGFSSSQGELMQMIEFSTEQVSADSKETGMALLVLLCFALVSAGNVLIKGLEKGDRTTHELLLKCVIIVTSVVPRQLPVQMAMAVNQALMALMKAGIFCTEPFRVPYAGKISHCLFDKTGTLTTDQLVPVGVLNFENHDQVSDRVKCYDASPHAALVLAACHSLVELKEGEGSLQVTKVIGDPIELAALKGVEWKYNASSQVATPGIMDETEKALTGLQEEVSKLKPEDPAAKKISRRIADLTNLFNEQKHRSLRCPLSSVSIKHRHHFSSDLQRMSVVVDVEVVNENQFQSGRYCLVKGSPEALFPLLAKGAVPSWYMSSYNLLAEEGMRVLALAYREVDPSERNVKNMENRKWVESDLKFAGFIAFTCKIRADSPTVVRALTESAHKVSMLTGDAPLTALKVAKDIGIASKKAPPLTLRLKPGTGGEGDKPAEYEWVGILARHQPDDNNAATGGASTSGVANKAVVYPIPLTVPGVRELSLNHDLVVLESVLEAVSEAYHLKTGVVKDPSVLENTPCDEGDIYSEIDAICIFARCSPHGKAKVIRSIQRNNVENYVLMCGDGGNDVGALKQADIGLALLSGYGNANTTDISVSGDSPEDPTNTSLSVKKDKPVTELSATAEEELNKQSQLHTKRAAEAQHLRKQLLATKQKELMSKQQEFLAAELKAMGERGEDTGVMGMMSAVKTVTMKIKREMDKEAALLNRKHGNVFDATEGKDADPMGGLDDVLPIVRPGDASVAAPFTSRTPSVRSVVTLIRQGRCTLLSALQQQQIMMLECIISAYALSALSLEGARSSERQMMASGWLIMTASLAFTYTKHIDEMHPVRPLRRLFHPAVFISMLGQACIHVFCMAYGVSMAKEVMGPDELKAVLDFHKAARAKELPEQQNSDEDPWAELKTMWMAPFKPNLLNTVVFLVETSQMIAVLFVNYKGRPWMKGLLENHPLFLSVFMCIAGVAGCAWGIRPELNELIHLEAFPDDEFRWKVMGLVFLSLGGTFIWDRLITALFAPDIFNAMLTEAKKTTFADILPILMTAGKVAGGLVILANGNILVIGGIGYYYYKQRQSNAAKMIS